MQEQAKAKKRLRYVSTSSTSSPIRPQRDLGERFPIRDFDLQSSVTVSNVATRHRGLGILSVGRGYSVVYFLI